MAAIVGFILLRRRTGIMPTVGDVESKTMIFSWRIEITLTHCLFDKAHQEIDFYHTN
jgi:hypothetical protein